MLSQTTSSSNEDSPTVRKDARIPIGSSIEPPSIVSANDITANLKLKNQSNSGGAEWGLPVKLCEKQATAEHAYDFRHRQCNDILQQAPTDEDDGSDVPELIAEDSVDAYESFTSFDLETPQHLSSMPVRTLSFTTPPPSQRKPETALKPVLTSCLKKPKTRTPADTIRPITERRVRGLWSPSSTPASPDASDSNCFASLRDSTILHCFSFLESNPSDLLTISKVGRRFHSIITTSPQIWRRIDATGYVQDMYQQSNHSSKQTTRALGQLLLKYQPESLTIRNVGNKLVADESFLPPGGGRLKELTLTHFEELTDTHIHVMLLLMALPPQQQLPFPNKKKIVNSPTSLQHLALEHCPQLTNAAVRSIASSQCCVTLESLSLRGNSQVNDVLPLAPLLKTQPQVTQLPVPPRRQQQVQGLSPLAGLFGPPPTSKPSPPKLQSLFDPPSKTTPLIPPLSPSKNTSLQSLFAPPGTSPPRPLFNNATPTASATVTISASTTMRSLARGGRAAVAGSLQNLNLCETKVSPNAWMECCRQATESSSKLIRLKLFAMDHAKWTNALLEEFKLLASCTDLQIGQADLPIVTNSLGLHFSGKDTTTRNRIVPGRNINV